MELTREDVLLILDLLQRSDVDYLELEVGGTRLVANRNGAPVVTGREPARQAAAPAAAQAPEPAAPAAPTAPIAPTAPAVAAVPAAPAPPVAEDTVTVTAPMVGVFYVAPEPGAAPYVTIGSTVAAGDTLGLVEVMKMFTSINASTAGTITEVLAENGDLVEYGQPLIRITPAGAAAA